MQKIIRRQIYLILLVATAIASPICSATSPPIVLQVDQIIKSKMSSAQEQQIEKAKKKVVDARTSGDTKSVEVAESNLAKKVESIDLTRKIIIIGRMQVTGRAQPGLAAASDSNFDSKVDGADLAMLLGNWGDAPRDQIPHSDCPLNLINP